MDPRSPIVWPIPQEMELRDDALPLGRAAVVVPADAQAAELGPARLLVEMIADDFGVVVPLVSGRAPDGRAPIVVSTGDQRADDLPEEGYALEVTAEGASLSGKDGRGAQHGVATLTQLAERRGDEVAIRGARIRDWPYQPVRMVHLYLPGADHLGYARRYLRDFLVRYKFSGLFVEVGGGVRLPDRPDIAQGWRRFVQELRAIGDTGPVYGEHCPLGPNRRLANSVHTHLADGLYIETDELARLAELARAHGLELVPEIQSLSHSYYLACAHREIAELPDADFPDAYCPCTPESYEILFDVMAAYVELTKCRSVHIGHDEWRAAGLCPKCRERDTGELFGEDVVKIASWLAERGLGVWMWGDHLNLAHNAGRRSHDNGKVWYDHPATERAAEIIMRGAPQVTILNWSWYLGAEQGDRPYAEMGFKQIYGNLDGREFTDWATRSALDGVLGAEISSWCAWDDFELGMTHYPRALYSANLLWSRHWPSPEDADETVARLLPKLRDRMRWDWEKPRLWSEATRPERRRPISICAACNAPRKTRRWDLSGLHTGRQTYDGIPFEIVDPAQNGGKGAVVVARLHEKRSRLPRQSKLIPVGGRYASLIFWQAATGRGGEMPHPGDGTNQPREAAELLGWYEIRFADGLTRCAEIRYGENTGAWDAGHELLYHAREAPAGTLPDGRALVIWGLEWTNPRPEVEIESVVLKGARALPETRIEGGASNARPMLLGITAVEHPRWEDYRPGKEGKLPGQE